MTTIKSKIATDDYRNNYDNIFRKKKTMQLFDVPRNTFVRVVGPTSAPPSAREAEDKEVIKFCHLDGMYSYCKDKDGNVVHLPAWQLVEIVD